MHEASTVDLKRYGGRIYLRVDSVTTAIQPVFDGHYCWSRKDSCPSSFTSE